jgi:hypothetical protein
MVLSAESSLELAALKSDLRRGGVKIVPVAGARAAAQRPFRSAFFAAVGFAACICAFGPSTANAQTSNPSPTIASGSALETQANHVWGRLTGHLRTTGTPQELAEARQSLEKNFDIRISSETLRLTPSDRPGFKVQLDVMVSGTPQAMKRFEGNLWLVRATTGSPFELDRNIPAPRAEIAPSVPDQDAEPSPVYAAARP